MPLRMRDSPAREKFQMPFLGSISAVAGDSIPPVLDLRRSLDPSFRDVRRQTDARDSTCFENKSK